jgi:hypothetical protein
MEYFEVVESREREMRFTLDTCITTLKRDSSGLEIWMMFVCDWQNLKIQYVLFHIA